MWTFLAGKVHALIRDIVPEQISFRNILRIVHYNLTRISADICGIKLSRFNIDS